METQLLAEALDSKRYMWLKWNLIGFVLWQGVRLGKEYVPSELNRTAFGLVIILVMLLGMVIWIVTLVRIIRLSKYLKTSPQLQAILNDELHILHKSKALAMGFWSLLFTQIAMQVVAIYYPFSALLGAQLSAFIGVAVVSISMLWYYR